MTDQLSFKTICEGSASKLDVIFVHGLTGNCSDTWTSNDGIADVYWPQWLCEDFQVGVYAIGYPASLYNKWAKQEMNLYERAINALECLASNKIGKRPVAFIAHSLGGILTKQILRTAIEATDIDWKSLAQQTRLVAFLATPHTGTSLAALLAHYAKPFSSTHVTALSNDCGQLDDLNSAYRNFAPANSIQSLAYYEKFKIKNMLFVDQHSADPGISGTQAIALDADHLSICKPKARDELIYLSISRHLTKFVAAKGVFAREAFESDDYTQPTEHDRRDLLQKLLDAGREHQYPSAREAQSKFAQRYYKLGLHTEAKLLHDDLLSHIEQRFNQHVYEDKICRHAPAEEVSSAIQTAVIDPICNLFGPHGITPVAVRRAIYFLTQQCHIRWDAP
jgi:hypothetical protein